MRVLLLLSLLLTGAPHAVVGDPGDAGVATQDLILVVGAPGSDEFGELFQRWSDRWEQAATQSRAGFQRVGSGDEAQIEDRQRLKQVLAELATDSAEPVWLILIGHGTFDGRSAKFNLRGPDISHTELNEWLAPITRPTIVINCASSSGPFINQLSAPHRILVTATKSGYEQNFARFGDHLSAAITDPRADLDKDEQISLLEAFLAASSRLADFYKQEARLATEHALLDDNGDGLGTPADWFQGVRATRSAKDGAAVDGLRANQLHLLRSKSEDRLTADQRERRDWIERKLEQLRQKKPSSPEDEYYQRLEPLLIELATLYADPDETPQD